MLKKLCQCIGIASLILVGNYGDLLGGGADARMHTPFSLARICYAQITDILVVALLFFVLFLMVARTRLYRWIQLLLVVVIPPYLIQRTQSFFPFDLIEGVVTIFLIVWAGLLLLLLLRYPKWYRQVLRVGGFLPPPHSSSLPFAASPNCFGSPPGSPRPTRSPPPGIAATQHIPSRPAIILCWSGSSSTNSPMTRPLSTAPGISASPTSTLSAPRAPSSPTLGRLAITP